MSLFIVNFFRLAGGLICTSLAIGRFYQEVFDDDENLHRNLITLNLFPHRLHDDKIDLLRTRLKLQLATRLWSPEKVDMKAIDISLYIQSLLASCENPRNFYSFNLVDLLKQSISNENFTLVGFDRYLSLFTMCLVSKTANEFESYVGGFNIRDLINDKNVINDHSITENQHIIAQLSRPNTPCYKSSEMREILMKTMATSCYAKLKPSETNHLHTIAGRDLNDMMAKVMHSQNDDGSFGDQDLTTTTLAVQAIIDSGFGKLIFLWNRKKAIAFINDRLKSNEATAEQAYYAVPAFYKTWSEIECRNTSSID